MKGFKAAVVFYSMALVLQGCNNIAKSKDAIMDNKIQTQKNVLVVMK